MSENYIASEYIVSKDSDDLKEKIMKKKKHELLNAYQEFKKNDV